MKLLYYTYRKLSLWLLFLMAVWGALFYYAIIDEVMDETDDSLENYAQIIINNALMDPSVLETEGNLMSFYFFHPLSEEEGRNHRDIYYDSFIYVESEDEEEPVRVLRTAFRMPDGHYYELELMISGCTVRTIHAGNHCGHPLDTEENLRASASIGCLVAELESQPRSSATRQFNENQGIPIAGRDCHGNGQT